MRGSLTGRRKTVTEEASSAVETVRGAETGATGASDFPIAAALRVRGRSELGVASQGAVVAPGPGVAPVFILLPGSSRGAAAAALPGTTKLRPAAHGARMP